MNYQQTHAFLSELAENNNKQWFDANRKRYEDVKADWVTTIGEIIKAIATFDEPIGELEPKNCTFRINRDVRFSKDKSPYKTNLGAIMSKGGKKSVRAGYYIQIDPKETFLASGIWMPESPLLFKIRQEIDYHFDEFRQIVEAKTFVSKFGKLESDKLVSVPKGFDKESPAAEYVKYKSFVGSKKFDISIVAELDFVPKMAEYFKISKPLNDFLDRALGG